MKDYELFLSDGMVVTWDGKDGVNACTRYANSHPGIIVIAWRDTPRHGIFAPANHRQIVE